MTKKIKDVETYLLYKDKDGNDIPIGIQPVFKTAGAACADVALPYSVTIKPHEIVKLPLNIAFIIPEGYYIRMYPRSSLLIKKGLMSPVSVIDTDYMGNVHVPFVNLTDKEVKIDAKERVAQIELVSCGPRPDSWHKEDSKRDQEGFGGTGKI